MTTATTVAGRPLSGWSRHARHGTWHALLPARAGERTLGALRVDRALLTPEGTRERLAAVVLATAKLGLPGLLGTVDLVAEAGEVWLLTVRPPAPTLADVLSSADGPRPDAGSVGSVLNETAQTLLALHTAGLTHGSLGLDTVVIAPDGVALLAETGLGGVLGDAAAVTVPGDAPHADRQAVGAAAWAALARTLGAAWTRPGTPAADLFARCSATAESEGLAAARAVLVAGRAALPADFLRRTPLRAAATASTPRFAPPKTPAPSVAGAPDGPSPRTDRHPTPTTTAPTPHPAAPEPPAPAADGSPRSSTTAAPEDVAPADDRSSGPSSFAVPGSPAPAADRSSGTSPFVAPESPVPAADRSLRASTTPVPEDAASAADGSSGTSPSAAHESSAPAADRLPRPSTTAASGEAAPAADGSSRPSPTATPQHPAPTPDRSAHPAPTAGQLAPAADAHSAAGPGRRPPLSVPEPPPSALAGQVTTVGRARRAGAPDTQATVLGKRNRATLPPVTAGEDAGEVLLRFGPGVPVDEQDVLRARWRTEAVAPTSPRSRRGRRGRLVTTAVVAIAAVLIWLLLRPAPAPEVLAVRVQAPAGPLHCGQTADLTGVVTTDGHGGPVTYRWLRADGQDSGELIRTAPRGERQVRVHLRWTVRGSGRFRGTARLRIAHRPSPMEAKASFTYVCP
ncbi:hypothetical protein AB0N17_43545 [Streptomyces sp. NPDC051133]|uniref:hypothetical protein n=1 Tax=Streptomyces sp. NPDC051133 TaxID=3155521 RepID=UPI00344424F7